MLPYTPTVNDKSYRKVMIKEKKASKPEDFKESQVIHYPDDAVLEITDKSGKVRLVYRDNDYNPPALRCSKTASGVRGFWINKKAQYMTRVYITDDKGMEYKIPNVLPTHKGPAGDIPESCTFVVPYTGSGLDVKGDKYFNKVFSISMV